jgi:16S rRNA (guanine966-N2)-methyltransferase
VRIIAGSVGGRRLKAPRGAATRPTADKVRQAIFNVLAARGAAPARVLDLYAGSGAFGLEALSRGAAAALFVERDAAACALIRDNAAALGFTDACDVRCRPVLAWLAAAPAQRFGWIFLDPPYAAADELEAALRQIAALLDDEGLAVAEHDWRRAPAETTGGLALVDRRRYGQTAVSFYTQQAERAHG